MTSETIQPDIFATGVVNLEACSKSKVGAGRFTLIKILGRGGMGIVWLARDELLAAEVALKFLPPQIRFDPVALDDLRRETSRSRKLTHPNIIRIHDFYEAKNEEAFISMEYIEGLNLAAVRMEMPGRVLTWEFLAPLVRQLCDGLEYAHGERVIHCDLKPANLILDAKSRLKLADFGIARTLNDTMTRASMNPGTSGTLLYMSPQQLLGNAPQVTDDIYALGATLYELLTSKPPFFSGDFSHQIRHAVPGPLNERLKEWGIASKIPAQVEQVILRCLAKDETKRPQSARDVAVQLGLISHAAPVVNFHRKIFRKNFYFATAGAVVTTAAISYFAFAGLAKKHSTAALAAIQSAPGSKPVGPRVANSGIALVVIQSGPGPKPVSDPWVANSGNAPPAKKENAEASAAVPAVLAVVPVAPPAKTIKPAAPVESAKIIDPPPPVPAPVRAVVSENFTALQLVKLGNHYVNDDFSNHVLQIVSDKGVGNLTPKNWRVVYRDSQAKLQTVEVRFADGKMTSVREPNRFLQIFSPRKNLDISKVKFDSDDALKIALDLPQVRAVSVIAVEMKLERGYGGLPVWTVELFGASNTQLADEKDLGTIQLMADSGKILKNTLVKKDE